MNLPESSPADDQFVALLTETQSPLRLYVRSLLPGDPAVADVTQQANATIWRKRADFELGTNFKAWAFAIARFEVLNYRKKQAHDARLVFSEELEETFADEIAQRGSDDEQHQAALQVCLQKLRQTDRDLLMHRYASEGTLKEFAERSGRSVNGLKVTLHRLRNRLLECIQHQLRMSKA